VQRVENDQLIDATEHVQQQACETHIRPEKTTVARQRKVKIQEYAVGAQPCDTSSTVLMPTVLENAGHALYMIVTGGLEPHHTVVHRGPAHAVIVTGALSCEMCDEKAVKKITSQNIWPRINLN